MIIHIPTKRSSNEIKSLIIVFVPLQFTLCRVVEHRGDHIRLLYDLLDGTSLTQKIVASLILPLIEILTIEDHKLDNTFFLVAFRSQNLLKSTIDQTGSGTN
jgi:hypothetical protein